MLFFVLSFSFAALAAETLEGLHVALLLCNKGGGANTKACRVPRALDMTARILVAQQQGYFLHEAPRR